MIPLRIPPTTRSEAALRVTLTGATGLIGTRLVRALQARGDEVTVLSRDPARAARALGVTAQEWDPAAGPAPAGGPPAPAARRPLPRPAGGSRPSRRRAGRPALERRRTPSDPRVARGRHAPPRRRPARRRPAAGRA